MRALSLYIRNFKSYADNVPELNFTGFSIVLLTGDNGNGKSSIAEAIAWCLWGQCKGAGLKGGADDLVRVGAFEMEVTFKFEEEGIVYRVSRKRDKKRGQTSLDLYISSGISFSPVGGSTIAETQLKIEKIIKLDFDTFLCTAYLSQGKADLFALKTPRERKEILSEILNLSLYDLMEKKASEKRRFAENECINLQNIIDRETITVEQSAGVYDESDKVNNTILHLRHEEEKLQNTIDYLKIQSNEFKVLGLKQKDAQETIKKLNAEVTSINAEIVKTSRRLSENKKIVDMEDEISKAYNQSVELRAEIDALEEKNRLYHNLAKVRDKLKQHVESVANNIGNQIKILENTIKVNAQKIEKLDSLNDEKIMLEKKIQILEKCEIEVVELEEKLKVDKDNLSSVLIDLNLNGERKKIIIEKYQKLAQAGSTCPTCDNVLSTEHKNHLIVETKELNQHLRQKEIELKNNEKNLRNDIDRLAKKLDDIKITLKGKALLDSKLYTIKEKIIETENLKIQSESIFLEKAKLSKQIETNDYEHEKLREIQRLDKELSDLAIDENDYDAKKSELKSLQHAGDIWYKLQHSKDSITSDEQTLANLNSKIQTTNSELSEISKTVKEIESKLKDSQRVETELMEAEKNKKAVTLLISESERKKGMLAEQLNNLVKAEKNIKEKSLDLEKTQSLVILYKKLIEVYGKSGIQASIIENTIPELEDYANDILTKITDGRLTLEFITQKEKVKGGVIETLDIVIFDESGKRKYDTYSGGEEFRINFAIRIALSKLMSYRAGASLRLLILDEGFGVLDEQGREKMVNAINAIKDEFDNILVITHIQDLKDAFPSRLEVSKTSQGSTFVFAH